MATFAIVTILMVFFDFFYSNRRFPEPKTPPPPAVAHQAVGLTEQHLP